MFFKAVVQVVILFGSETWVLIPHMGRVVVIFQYRVSRWITKMQPKRREDGGWEYPPLDTAMEEAGFNYMGAYVLKMQNMVMQYITMRPIIDLC